MLKWNRPGHSRYAFLSPVRMEQPWYHVPMVIADFELVLSEFRLENDGYLWLPQPPSQWGLW